MTDLVFLCLAFACGGFVGFIIAAVLSVGRAADAEFDGGFRANYSDPVRTRIWSDHVDKGGKQ